MLAETLGRPPTLDAGLAFGNGALMCSWSGQPGSVTMTLTDDPSDLQRYLRHPPGRRADRRGRCAAARRGRRAMSSPEVAATWWSRSATTSSSTLQVIPAAGFTDDGIDTTRRANATSPSAGLAPADRMQSTLRARRRRAARGCRAAAAGSTLVWPTTGMKLVSPPQRGTTCWCRCAAMPAPATVPWFIPMLKPCAPLTPRGRRASPAGSARRSRPLSSASRSV